MSYIDLGANPFYLNDSQQKWVRDTLATMSDDDKIRHLFCLVAYSDDEKECRYMAEEVRPGAFMCRTMSAAQCLSTVKQMQEHSKIPLLVAANLEGGGNGVIKEGTNYAKPMQIGATADAEFARRLGEICGVEGSAVGVNWSFAPIVDIDYNWRNPITNVRTFGSDPALIADMGAAYAKESQKRGVAACFKHFPGDGRDERDQHVAISSNDLSCEEWDQTYGSIYRAGIEAGVQSIMVGHILQPAYEKHFCPALADSELLPASLSPRLVTDLLRKKLGFNGLVITDSTAMIGLSLFLPREELVPRTIAAGCDMFLFTKNTEEDLMYMRQGYEKGIFDRERLDDAVTRILALKAALGLPEKKEQGTLVPSAEALSQAIQNPVYREWSKECSARSITLVKEEKGIFPITPKRFPRVLFCPLRNMEQGKDDFSSPSNINRKFFDRLTEAGFDTTVFHAEKVNEGQQTSAGEMKEKYDLIIYSVSKRVRYQPVTRVAWETPQAANAPIYCHTIPTVFVSFEGPYYLLDLPHMRTYINCYGDSESTIRALVDKMTGKSDFVGISPVDPFCGKWETRLSYGPDLHLEEIQ